MAVPGDNQLIEVSRLLGGKPLQAEIIQDEQVRTEKEVKGPPQGVVDPVSNHLTR